MYQILLETRARRELLDLPKDIQVRLMEVVDDLSFEPRPPGVKKLTGVDGYRVRKGDCRILYTIDDKKKQVFIYCIGHRRDVYR